MNSIALVLVTLLAVQCWAKSRRGIRGYAGDCPFQRPSVHCERGFLFSSEDDTECFADVQCLPSMKCCTQGCTSRCVPPVHYSRWCQAPLDLAILFDSQASTWPKVKNMINKVIHRMTIRRDATHLALRTISKHSQLLLGFNQLSGSEINRVNVWRVIKDVAPEKRSGKLGAALKNAKDMFNETNGARQNGIKVLLVITDANIDSEESSLVQAATKALRDSNVLVQTVGITIEMSLMNLVEIATSDMYVWPGVDHEMLNGLKKLQKEPCHFK